MQSSEQDSHAQTQLAFVIWLISVSMRCQHRAGRCDKGLQEPSLSSSEGSGRVSEGCQMPKAACAWAAKSRLASQDPTGVLHSTVGLMLGHTDSYRRVVTPGSQLAVMELSLMWLMGTHLLQETEVWYPTVTRIPPLVCLLFFLQRLILNMIWQRQEFPKNAVVT